MRVLLLRPDPGNDRFGLGPFFRVEPLGLGYVAQALVDRGHEPTVADLRFGGLRRWLRRSRPRLVGISCMHALEIDQVLELAGEIRRRVPGTFVLVGGQAAAAFPEPFDDSAVDAVCLDDGEEVMPALADALEAGRPATTVPALRLRSSKVPVETPPLTGRTDLDRVPLPNRTVMEPFRSRYHCLLFKPV
ncbi:MAG: cobalamin-dependent protein [Thermoanaerobaculia bacterium]|nr:cobalamin-dependent protein [Thermoanaerobaculia bacterium]